MKLSYAITVCNEHEEIKHLLLHLIEHISEHDEIVILYDKSHGTEDVDKVLESFSSLSNLSVHEANFNNHFAEWKNKFRQICEGDFIFQIDADEIPSIYLILNIHDILESNPDVDLYWVPRENYVKGLTVEHIRKWNWVVDDQDRINYPDYQSRLYRNNKNIKWVNTVHEIIKGYEKHSHLPVNQDMGLIHRKEIERQERQNEYYTKIITGDL